MGQLVRTGIGLAVAALVLVAPTVAQPATTGSVPVLAWSPSASGSFNFGMVQAGKTASQTFTLTNSGGTATGMLTVALSGSTALTKTADGCTATSLGPKKSCSVTVRYAPTSGPESDTGTLTATSKKPAANASVTLKGASTAPPAAQDPIVTKTANPTFTRTYSWTIAKSIVGPSTITNSGGGGTFNYSVMASETGFHDSGWGVTGVIEVTNPNNATLRGVNVTSDQITDSNGAADPHASCAADAGNNLPITVAAHATVDITYTCTFSGAPSSNQPETNTAVASWYPTLSDGSVTPHSNNSPGAKTQLSFSTPTTLANQTVTPTDRFNGGTAANLCTLQPQAPCTLTASDDNANLTTQTYTYSRTVQGTGGTCVTYSNTAGFVEISPTSSATVTYCVAEDLSATVDANPGFTRTYNWSIQKSVVGNSTITNAGGGATFDYSVAVNELAPTDSSIKATGTITISNPNDFESITLTNVTDSVDNGGSCSFNSGSTTAIVPAGGSVQLTYTCAYTSVPANGTDTATATWDEAAAATPDGSAQGQAPVQFGAPTSTVSLTITPTDAFNNGTAVNLCTLQASTPCTLTGTDPPSTATSQTYTYSRTVQGTAGTCVQYPNTAATGTGPTSSQTVTYCIS